MSILMNNTYRCSANLDMMEVEGEFLILDSNRLTVTKLNTMGGMLWSYLQRDLMLDQIYSLIQEEYEIEDADVERDVSTFLEDLCQLGLVEYVPLR